jgi:eukaryotic-like serine/threonine-protein kinase
MNSQSLQSHSALATQNIDSQDAVHPRMSTAVLLAEMLASNWRRGLFRHAEDFLAEHPSVAAHAPAAVRVICEEICQRQELGQDVCLAEFGERFPHLQRELEIVYECLDIIGMVPAPPRFPIVGDVVGEFRLLAELGRGGMGRVFLAEQGSLSERLVILKLGPRGNQEHLNLARLQHTHIVPLYSVCDFPESNLRQLCMPCLGGATLHQLLHTLRNIPVEKRTGRSLLEALPQSTADARLFWVARGPNRRFLEQASYVQAICWIGVCVAEGLHYAHEQGLVHLDVKPSNVLLTADCQPMLLDFHLARRPLVPDGRSPDWLGGTLAFMSPEQRNAWQALGRNESIQTSVDARSDVYSLGLLLAAALSNKPMVAQQDCERLALPAQPDLSRGLRDIIACALRTNPEDRYGSAARLAEDLRRHLTHRPLLVAPNRSVRERFLKWRRRKPRILPSMLLAAVCIASVAALSFVHFSGVSQRRRGAQDALTLGASFMYRQHFSDAADAFLRGMQQLGSSDSRTELYVELAKARQCAIRAQGIEDLHGWIERGRYLQDDETRSRSLLQELEKDCAAAWSQRSTLLAADAAPLPAEYEERVRRDLLDVALLWSDCQRSLVSSSGLSTAKKSALRVLDEAESLLGPNATLDRERQFLITLDESESARRAARFGAPRPASAWEYYSLGRWLLRHGLVEDASIAFDQAVDLRPQDFWPWFGVGLCAYRQHASEKAVSAFSVCIALSPANAICFYDRALAYAQLGDTAAALRDYNRALSLDSTLTCAFANRGALHLREGRLGDASNDLEAALRLGGNQADLHYNLALVCQARRQFERALTLVQRALEIDPNHQRSRQLQLQLAGPTPNS